MLRKFNFLMLLCLMQFTIAAQTITGSVLDEFNEALIGVNILEQGTSNGTITDIDGNFSIDVSDPNATLEISYLGYEKKTIPVNGQTSLNVTMGVNDAELEEVVIIGYGVQKKAVVTGAISKVKGEDLENQPLLRIENSIQGRTSGVRVTSGSGQPGEGATVRIRGTTSIGSSDPLYVVDGIPIGGGIDYLNQGDIESIEVLKDAASASIYGARSSAGVILVTTKSGKKDQLEVNYNAYYGTQAPSRKLALLNATEYATIMNEMSVASGGSILYDDPQSLGEGTDWQDAIFRTDAPILNHDISLRAGSDRSSYFASFSFFDQDGIVSQDRSNYQRFTARFNSTHDINDHIRFGNTLGYTRVKSVGVSTNSEFGSPLSRAINLDPITPLLETDPDVLSSSIFQDFEVVANEDGIPYGISPRVTSEILNPVAALAIEQGFGWSDKIVANVFGEISLFDGFKFRSSIGADLAFWGGEGFSPVFYLNAANRNDINSYNRSQNRGLFYNFQNTVSYNRLFGLHSLELTAGTVAEKNQGQGLGGTIRDIPVDNIDDASLAFPTPQEEQSFFGFEYLNTLLSYLGRVNYNYNEKYLFSASIRADGSSRFGANNRFGYFPSVSLGWVLTEESFLSTNPNINFFKIRGSWGVNGSDAIGDFRFVSTLGGARNYTFGLEDDLTNGVSPNAIANPDLRWEQTTQTNIGFDAKIFRKLSVTFDAFDKTTTDMLLGIAVPGYIGNGGPIGNIASMSNRGLELELGYANNINAVGIDIKGNVSYVENEVTSLGDDREFLPGQEFSPQGLEITRTEVGLPIGYFYGFSTDGIFQNQAEIDAYANADGAPIQPDAVPGDFRFVDSNGNGEIDPDDRGFIGDPTPSWTYGITANVNWKNFDLLVFGQGVAGNEIFKATRRFDLQQANLTGDALDRWTGEGTTDTYPRLTFNDTNNNFSRSSDFYLQNGSYFRIKTLQLGYTLPESVTDNVGFKRVRFYVSGNNILTFTGYNGLDPEIGGGSFGVDRGLYPQPRFYLVGVNASF
jgi:TonB-linked SusC/RagA family outer membrane protein